MCIAYSYIRKGIVKLYNLYIQHRFKLLEGLIISPQQLRGERYISIGKGTCIDRHSILTAWDYYENESFAPRISIGEKCYIGEYSHITAINDIYIGNNVLTGRYIYISDNSHGDPSDITQRSIPPINRSLKSKGAVIIEDNVWIGERVCILSGVKIGYGAIIGANSVVTKDVPPFSVSAGVPAKVIRTIK